MRIMFFKTNKNIDCIVVTYKICFLLDLPHLVVLGALPEIAGPREITTDQIAILERQSK